MPTLHVLLVNTRYVAWALPRIRATLACGAVFVAFTRLIIPLWGLVVSTTLLLTDGKCDIFTLCTG